MGAATKALFLAMLLIAAGSARAQAPDVGLVNQVAGEVSYSSGSGAGKVQAFMRVRQADRFNLPAGAQLRVVYFQNGRQETWRGPASFNAGVEKSDVLSGAVQEVATLPAGVPQRIQRIPDLVQMAKLGGIQVRGSAPKPRANPEQQAETAAARATYAQLRQQAPQDDITPELYLFAALQEHLQYDEMKSVADEMLRRQPASQEARQLAEWARARAGPPR